MQNFFLKNITVKTSDGMIYLSPNTRIIGDVSGNVFSTPAAYHYYDTNNSIQVLESKTIKEITLNIDGDLYSTNGDKKLTEELIKDPNKQLNAFLTIDVHGAGVMSYVCSISPAQDQTALSNSESDAKIIRTFNIKYHG